MTHRLLISLAASAIGLTLGCGGDERPGGVPSIGGSSNTGGSSGSSGSAAGGNGTGGDAGDSSGGDAGASTGGSGGSDSVGGSGGSSSGSGGSGAEAGGGSGGSGMGGSAGAPIFDECPSDEDPGSPTMAASECDPEGGWGAETAVTLPASDGDQLIAITPDELTIVWVASSMVAPPLLQVADRASSADDFDPPQEISGGSPIGIAADGLTLIALNEFSNGFLESTRTARGEPFGSFSEGTFASFNAEAALGGMLFFAATVSADLLSLYAFGETMMGFTTPTWVSTRASTSDPWPEPIVLDECELTSYQGRGQLPTGLSQDGLTLFYFDSARRVSRAAWRETTSSPFTWFVDLDGVLDAMPNAACDRLYYASGSSIVFAPAE